MSKGDASLPFSFSRSPFSFLRGEKNRRRERAGNVVLKRIALRRASSFLCPRHDEQGGFFFLFFLSPFLPLFPFVILNWKRIGFPFFLPFLSLPFIPIVPIHLKGGKGSAGSLFSYSPSPAFLLPARRRDGGGRRARARRSSPFFASTPTFKH